MAGTGESPSLSPDSKRAARTRAIGVWSTLALALLSVLACTSTPPARYQTQDEAAAAVRSEIRLILPHLGTGATDLDERLGVCGAMLDGSHLMVLSSLQFAPDEALLARMPSGYLAEKKSQGWVVTDHSRENSIYWSVAQPGGVGILYSLDAGSKRGVILANGPCLPASAGRLATQSSAR